MRNQCFSILSGYFTLTTWYNVYVLPPLVTVILIVALPFLTALTLPFLETLATFLLDVAYLTVAPLGVSLLAATVVVPSLALAVVVVGAVVVSPAAGFVVVSPVAGVVVSSPVPGVVVSSEPGVVVVSSGFLTSALIISISARPTAVVDSETSSTTNLMFLTSLPSPRLISLTAPSFGSSPTSSVVPSSNSKWDFVMWSSVLGLS